MVEAGKIQKRGNNEAVLKLEKRIVDLELKLNDINKKISAAKPKESEDAS